MKTMGNIMLCLSFLTVCLCGTGCFFFLGSPEQPRRDAMALLNVQHRAFSG